MSAARRPIALLSALPQELALLRGWLQPEARLELAGFTIEQGRIDGQAVALAHCVPGKVNAASLATLMAQVLNARAILFSGVAGGLNPQRAVLDIIIAERVIQHDYGAVKAGEVTVYRPGATTIGPVVAPIDYRLPPGLAQRLAGIDGAALGTVLTGDLFINCDHTRQRLHRQFGGDAVEMEGGAVAQVAERFGLPWVIIRALSDLAGADSDRDFTQFLDQAAARAASVARQALQLL